jgi:hypothetical protein
MDDVPMMKPILIAFAGLTLIGGALVGAPAGLAADVTLTSAQLTDSGFPKKPNVSAWGGTAQLGTHRAPQWTDVVIRGTAGSSTQPGQVLTMQRYIPDNAQGDGTFKPLNISTTVGADRSFVLHFQLGQSGLFGYRVGYSTDSPTPEFVGFQFQFETTGSGVPAPNTGSASAVQLTAKQLRRAGFTRVPNVVGWGGTATIARSSRAAGEPITIAGNAPQQAKAGQVLQLRQFVPTDRKGSGHFEATGFTTKVQRNGSYSLTFTQTDPGVVGYTIGYPTKFEWIGIEFQVRTR